MRAFADACVSARARRATAVEIEDLLQGLHSAIGKGLWRFFEGSGAMRKLVLWTRPPRKATQFEDTRTWRHDGERTDSPEINLGFEVLAVVRDADAIANREATNEISVQNLIQAMKENPHVTGILEKHGVRFRLNVGEL